MLIKIKNYDVSFLSRKYKPQNPKSTNIKHGRGSSSPVADSFTPASKSNHVSTPVDHSYHNVLAKTLKSTPNSDFVQRLKEVPDIQSLSKAIVRIANLSRYLKEDMVGFILPGPDKNQWFQKASENLLRGSKEEATEKEFPSIAKNLYGLLSLHDNYWKSREFSDYLSTLKQTPAIKATKQAIQELQKSETISFGYRSALKRIDKLLNDGCAYSGIPLLHGSGKSPDKLASVDHILPKSWGGSCTDDNYILCSSKTNSERGNISLLDFLKGNDDR
ncbi:MAG: hypothetical protein WC197_06265 [Candidatus Gastranaerophilaceae bacterium]|jgi:hypothetical protein